jgi:hypothetical protein
MRCRSGFSRDLCLIEGGGSGLKPLLPKGRCVVGAASAANPYAIEDGRLGLWSAASSVAFWDLEGGSSGRKPLPPNERCVVRAASAATFASPKMEGFGCGRAASFVVFWDLEERGSGRKPLLPKERRVVGAASAANPCIIEGEGFSCGRCLHPRPFGILKAEVQGGSPSHKDRCCWRNGFSRDLCVIKGRGSELCAPVGEIGPPVPAGFIPHPFSRFRSEGLSANLGKNT